MFSAPIDETRTSEANDADARTRFAMQHEGSLGGVDGGVYILPKLARGEGDNKEERRHVLVVRPSAVRTGTAMYGSKATTAKDLQAPTTPVLRDTPTIPTGLTVKTYFDATSLTYVYTGDLDDRRGVLGNVYDAPLRRELRKALGIGAGRAGDAGVATASWRGRIVGFPPEIESMHRVNTGVVLTCHEHSVHRYNQIVIPLLVSDPNTDDPEQDVVSSDVECRRLMTGASADPVVWAVPLTFSIHQRRQPLEDLALTISLDDLSRIEDALIKRFRL